MTDTMRRLGEDGFTAQELVVVILLFVAIIIPSLFLLHPKNSGVQMLQGQRRLAVAELMQEIHVYVRATGHLPSDIPAKMEPIGTAAGQVNLCEDLAPTYIKTLPVDPIFGNSLTCAGNSTYETGLGIEKTDRGTQVTIAALGSEGTLIYLTD